MAAPLAVPAGEIGLAQAVSRALQTNPQVARAEAERRAAERDVRAARAGFLPSLDLDAGYGRERSNIKALRLNGDDDRITSPRELGLTARQMIFDGMLTRSTVQRRNALLEASDGDREDARESVAFRAVQAYIEVLRARRLVALARDNLSAHETLLAKVRERVSSGVGRRADLHQATGRVALARSTLSAREGALREARSRYRRVIGEPPGTLAEPEPVAPGFTTGGRADSEALAAAIEAATREALRDHPAYRAARARVAAAEAAVAEARAGYWPRLDLEARMRRDGDLSGVDGTRNQDAIMLVSRWNLFRGGADRAREDSAAARREAAKQEARDRRQAIEEAVAVAVQAKATSEERIAYLEDYVTASEQTLSAYQAQFELGRRTLLDLLNAQNELFLARSNLATARYEDLLNHYFVAASKGRLVRSLGLAGAQ